MGVLDFFLMLKKIEKIREDLLVLCVFPIHFFLNNWKKKNWKRIRWFADVESFSDFIFVPIFLMSKSR